VDFVNAVTGKVTLAVAASPPVEPLIGVQLVIKQDIV
jgi:hypothetical protein